VKRPRGTAILVIAFVTGFVLFGKSGYYYAKGILAQYLLNTAWEKSLFLGKSVKAWDWANTHPVGKLIIPSIGLEQIILEGANNESLAFGPAHITGTSSPGEHGNICIAGHRDSYFRELGNVAEGDIIELETQSGRWIYRVSRVQVIDGDDSQLLEETPGDCVTLITCYPFNFIGPAPKRFVVRGISISLVLGSSGVG